MDHVLLSRQKRRERGPFTGQGPQGAEANADQCQPFRTLTAAVVEQGIVGSLNAAGPAEIGGTVVLSQHLVEGLTPLVTAGDGHLSHGETVSASRLARSLH